MALGGTELAKAYVQIIPSAQGFSSKLKEITGGSAQEAGSSSGGSFGKSLLSKLGKLGIGMAIGKMVGSAFSEGAALQQSLGGIETLFKDSYETVKGYAQDAYKTAGLSANEYMETATSFSAGLIASLGGDTKKAADITDMAIKDMSDNANKMGTDMSMIQNAYQGFARQNYTMLDNLRLGYGGTKTEMERLLADAEKLSGVHYDISSLSDVYSAIHVVQQEMGITGTTAEEASHTFSGSFNMMKASVKDFLGSLTMGEDVTPALENLVSSVSVFLFDNVIPMLGNLMESVIQVIVDYVPKLMERLPEFVNGIVNFLNDNGPAFIQTGMDLISSLIQGIVDSLPTLMEGINQLIAGAIDFIINNFPTFLEQGVGIVDSLIQGIISSIPSLFEGFMTLLSGLVEFVLDNLPMIVELGIDLIVSLIEGIVDMLPELVETAIELVGDFAEQITTYDWLSLGIDVLTAIIEGIARIIPKLLQTAGQIISELLQGITGGFGRLVSSGGQMLSSVVSGITGAISRVASVGRQIISTVCQAISGAIGSVVSVGRNIVTGIWNGISSGISWLTGQISSFGSSVMSTIKRIFKIGSPSRLMRDEVGKNLVAGIGIGITDNIGIATRAMQRMGDEMMDEAQFDFTMSNTPMSFPDYQLETGGSNYQIVVNANLDGTPIKVAASDYTIRKINQKAASNVRLKGGAVYE